MAQKGAWSSGSAWRVPDLNGMDTMKHVHLTGKRSSSTHLGCSAPIQLTCFHFDCSAALQMHGWAAELLQSWCLAVQASGLSLLHVKNVQTTSAAQPSFLRCVERPLRLDRIVPVELDVWIPCTPRESV